MGGGEGPQRAYGREHSFCLQAQSGNEGIQRVQRPCHLIVDVLYAANGQRAPAIMEDLQKAQCVKKNPASLFGSRKKWAQQKFLVIVLRKGTVDIPWQYARQCSE